MWRRLTLRWRRRRVRGQVDGVYDGKLQGWAVDPRAPDEPLTLLIEAGGESLRIRADGYRADVHQSGICDGDCGFAVPVSRLPKGVPCRIIVEKLGVEIEGSPVDPHAPPPPAVAYADSDYAFRLDDGAPTHGLTGYAVDSLAPDSRRRLALRRGEFVFVETRAGLQRDEAEAFAPDGLHGFVFPPIGAAAPLDLVDVESGRVLARLQQDGGRARWSPRRPGR